MVDGEDPASPASGASSGPPAAQNSAVRHAVTDLAGRLDADVGRIEVAGVEHVTWRDGSLGCPQPDMMYTQALVDGMRIVLTYDGRRFEYHSGGDRDPFLCEHPEPPLTQRK